MYVTARPDIQHYKVTNWLAQHNFPLGMVFFSDGISTDPIKQKTEILRSLTINSNLKWAFWTENEKSEQFIFHRATTPAIRVIKSLNSQTGKYLEEIKQIPTLPYWQ